MGAIYTDYEIIFPKDSTDVGLANVAIEHIASILEWNVTKVATGTSLSSTNYAECTEPTKGYASLRIYSVRRGYVRGNYVFVIFRRKTMEHDFAGAYMTIVGYEGTYKAVLRIYKTVKGGCIIRIDKAEKYYTPYQGIMVLPVISLLEGNEDKLISLSGGNLSPQSNMTLFSGDNPSLYAYGSGFRAYNDEVQMLTKCLALDTDTNEIIYFIEGLYSTAKALNVFEIGDEVLIGEKKYILVLKNVRGTDGLSYVDGLAELE